MVSDCEDDDECDCCPPCCPATPRCPPNPCCPANPCCPTTSCSNPCCTDPCCTAILAYQPDDVCTCKSNPSVSITISEDKVDEFCCDCTCEAKQKKKPIQKPQKKNRLSKIITGKRNKKVKSEIIIQVCCVSDDEITDYDEFENEEATKSETCCCQCGNVQSQCCCTVDIPKPTQTCCKCGNTKSKCCCSVSAPPKRESRCCKCGNKKSQCCCNVARKKSSETFCCKCGNKKSQCCCYVAPEQSEPFCCKCGNKQSQCCCCTSKPPKKPDRRSNSEYSVGPNSKKTICICQPKKKPPAQKTYCYNPLSQPRSTSVSFCACD